MNTNHALIRAMWTLSDDGRDMGDACRRVDPARQDEIRAALTEALHAESGLVKGKLGHNAIGIIDLCLPDCGRIVWHDNNAETDWQAEENVDPTLLRSVHAHLRGAQIATVNLEAGTMSQPQDA